MSGDPKDYDVIDYDDDYTVDDDIELKREIEDDYISYGSSDQY